MTTKLKFSAPEVSQALNRLAGAIVAARGSTQNLLLVGVADGGVGVAHRLAEKIEENLGRKIPLGIVDVSFHRDDIGSNPIPKAVVPTNLPPQVEGSSCILIDDVIFSGRTIRAALNELFDQGRPACVELAVLVDRGHRCLPFSADYVGIELETTLEQNVKVSVGSSSSLDDHVTVTPL
jgi:pyrimidine operon attenuation protein/uracil phosphoribosyltransferase